MAEGRVAHVRSLVAGEPPDVPGQSPLVDWLRRLCRAAVRDLPVTGAGVSLTAEGGVPGVAAASDRTLAALEELQVTVGEGPCIDAFSWHRPVLAADLTDGARTRWPGYAPAALEHGLRAVFALPLQIGAAQLGVLTLYRDRPGALPADDLALALTFAEVAVSTIVDGQALVQPGESAGGLDAALEHRHELYQAQGMVMVQLGVDLGEAMVRLRAYAYRHDRPLGEVAGDVVDGGLRLAADHGR